MPRILAIDYGNRRVGLAVTDPLQIIASPFKTIDRKEAEEFIISYIKQEQIEDVVVGQPFRADGSLSDVESDILAFIDAITKNMSSINIHRIDESFTSKQAMKALIQSGVKKKQRRDKSLLDSTSAALILQQYLEQI
jgi:putative Holliday junction resolvase